MASDDLLADALNRLYAAPPDEFTATRTQLVAEAKASGDAKAAAEIGKVRKPTVAAWIVNALVLDDADAVDRLTDVGDRLRAAQERLDAGELRDLTGERRRAVDEVTRAALAKAGRRDPGAGLRDEIRGTFDAAVADPEIAQRLGRLQRSEQWSGFGFAATGSPQLTVVRGGRSTSTPAPAKKSAPAAPAPPKKSAAERRKEQKAVADAQKAFDAAEAAFAQAQQEERELGQRVKHLGRRLAKLQDELDTARSGFEAARKDAATARTQRRDARTALDRAERAARD